MLTFADVHFASMFASVGDTTGVNRLIESFAEKGGAVRIEVGVPLAQAVADYCSGAYKQAQKALIELRGRIIEIGGSHTQRDIFELLMIEASIKSGDTATARHMLENRTKLNPSNGLNWKKLAEILPGVDEAAANKARARAAELLMA
jgi:predicted Zn-dependent protease